MFVTGAPSIRGGGGMPQRITGGLPMGSAKDLETAKAEFKTGWIALKARHTPEQLASAYMAMNIGDEPEPEPRGPRPQRFN
jgi:hypothetical protein